METESMHGIKVRNVAILACIGLAVSFPTFAVESQQEQDAQPDLQQAVELIEDGDFAAAATILEALTTDPVDDELELSDARDMVLAYLYLGIARLYLADDNDAREAFQDAQRLDPAYQPEVAEVPRRVLDVWQEVRDLGAVVVITAPDGAAVYVDGEMQGYSPVDVALLPPGEYRILVTNDGYIESSRVVSVTPGSDETLRFELARADVGPGAVEDSGLRIVVLEGEDSLNIIGQGTAVPVVVEVRDRNDLPVSGATVLFVLREGSMAMLNGGPQPVASTTNALGQAAVTVNPVASGAVQLQVSATFQGQTATAAIVQSNVASTAVAGGAADRSPGESGSAVAGGASGGGIGTGTLLGIAAAGGGAAVAGVVLAGGGSPPVAALDISPNGLGMAELTNYRFDGGRSTDPDQDTLSYTWEFGDNGRGSGVVAMHIYDAAGTYSVTLTVNDSKHQALTTGSLMVAPSLDGRFAGTLGNTELTVDLDQNAREFSGQLNHIASSYHDRYSVSGSVDSVDGVCPCNVSVRVFGYRNVSGLFGDLLSGSYSGRVFEGTNTVNVTVQGVDVAFRRR
ncbi:MAG: PEGA domain-containing protein [Acidobacteria bacterium]|nr:PEGA domain-containing protein [Acidobacteriota bacterium]